MSDFEIHIKTSADLKAAEDLKRSLQEQAKATKALGQDSSTLESQLKKVDSALNSSSAQAVRLAEAQKRTGESIRKLGGDSSTLSAKLKEMGSHVPGLEKLTGVFAGLASGTLSKASFAFSALAGAALVAKRAISEFAAAEDEVIKLNAALATTDQLTAGYSNRLQELASRLQAVTGIADEEWLKVITKLTQFGADSSNIEKYTKAVEDLAGIIGGDLNTAANMIARAMQGNFDLFGRYGIVVGEAASQTEKLNRLFEDLALRGSGQLQASMKGLSGFFKQFSNSCSDLLEAIGGIIAKSGVLQESLGRLAIIFKVLADLIALPIGKFGDFQNAILKTTERAEANSVATTKMEERLLAVKAAAEAAAAALRNETQALDEQKQAQDRIADAGMALELAKVARLKKSKKISDVEALNREQQIREVYANRKFQNEQAAIGGKIRAGEEVINEIDKNYFRQESGLKETEQTLRTLEEFEALKLELRKLQAEIEGRSNVVEKQRALKIATEGQSESAQRIEGFMPDVLANEEDKLGKAKQRKQELFRKLLEFSQTVPPGVTLPDVQNKLEEQRKRVQAEREGDSKVREETAREIERLRRSQGVNRRVHDLDRRRSAEEFGGNVESLESRAQEKAEREREKAQREREKSRRRGFRSQVGPEDPISPLASTEPSGGGGNTVAATAGIKLAGTSAAQSVDALGQTTVAAFGEIAGVAHAQQQQIREIQLKLNQLRSVVSNQRLT